MTLLAARSLQKAAPPPRLFVCWQFVILLDAVPKTVARQPC